MLRSELQRSQGFGQHWGARAGFWGGARADFNFFASSGSG